MGVVSGLLARAASVQGRPFFSAQHCINKKQTKHRCRTCAQLCPAGAIPENPARGKINWEACTNCGLCVAQCPSRCFSPDLMAQKVYSDPIKSEAVGIVCAEAGKRRNVRKVECVCGTPWEWLAALALQTRVIIYTGACENCKKTGQKEHMAEKLKRVEEFLGSRLYRERVETTDDLQSFHPDVVGPRLDRREFFGMLTHGLKQSAAYGVSSVIPFPDEDAAKNALVYRKYLAGAVKSGYVEAKEKNEAPPSYRVLLPVHNKNCFACGICERICPHHALSTQEEKDGTRVIDVTPADCTGCGLCTLLCPYGGIDGLELTEVQHMDRQPLVQVRSESCARCGTAIRPETKDSLCPACAARGKRRK